MPNFLSESDITGIAPAKGDAAAPVAKSPYLDEATITGVKPAPEEPSIWGFVKEVAKGNAGLGTSLAELIAAGPGMVVGEIVGQLQKVQEVFKGKSPEEASAIGAQIAQNVARGLNPVTKLKELFGYEPPKNEVDAVMDKIGGAVRSWARANESAYRGPDGKPLLPAGDYESLANFGMGLGGTKPLKAGAEAIARKITEPEKASAARPEAAASEDAVGPPSVDEAYRQPVAPLVPPTPAEISARAKQRMTDLKAAAKAESVAEKQARMGAQNIPSGEQAIWSSADTDFPVEVTGNPITGPDGKRYTPVRYNGNDTFVPESELKRNTPPEVLPTDEFMGPPKPGPGDTPKTRLGDGGKTLDELRTGPPAYESALEKVKAGQGFLLTAEEKVSLQALNKASGSIVDSEGKPLGTTFGPDGKINQQLLSALGITSAATWAYLNPEDQDKLVSLGLVGATMLPEGRSALRPLLDKIKPYTSTMLERLPEGRTEFSRTHLEQELKRPDISGAEKAVFERVLGAIKGDKVSAKALVDGFAEETANWRLTPKETTKYADYGLENIDRSPDLDPDDMSSHFELAEERAAFLAEGNKFTPATTTLYRLPDHMQVSDANHFGDSRLFGWTRSFEEGGVRHVVELQSDLAQHAKQALSPEERAGLERRMNDAQEHYQWLLKEQIKDGAHASQEVMDERVEQIQNQRLRMVEIQNKLNAPAVNEQLSPILKNWPRRLIREELVKAGDAPVVRFATADTVAKVEGWPTRVSYTPSVEVMAPEAKKFRRSGSSIGEVADFVSTGEVFTDPVGGGEVFTKGNLVDVNGRPIGKQNSRIPAEFLTKGTLAKLGKKETFSPEHESIYKRYAGEITRYLKGLGGKEVTDAAGHTWIETPTAAVATPRGPAVKMFGAADTKFLATLGLGTAAVAAIANSPDLDKLSVLGLLGVTLVKHPEIKGLPESALIEAFRAGGKEGELAAAKLYTDNIKPLERSLRSYAKSGIPVEDVAQETFIRAFEALKKEGGFKGDAKFSTFLHVIAKRLANTKFRETRNSPVEFKDVQSTDEVAGLEETAGHEMTPELEIANKTLLEKMSTALDKLPENFRRSFEMSELEGLPDAEIAAQLGIPIGTVKSQISRAKAQLQGSLRDYRDLQAGKADPRLLAGIAVLGGGAMLGAYLNPDKPIKAALYGAGIATLLMSVKPREWAEAIKRAQTDTPIVRIDEAIRDRAYTMKVGERATMQMQRRITQAVPDKARRQEIYNALENERPTNLTPKEQAVFKDIQDFFKTTGEAAAKAGVVKSLLDDYATRIYGKALSDIGTKTVGGGTRSSSPFGLARQFKTRAEAEAAGFTPRTTDIAEVLGIYTKSVNTAIANKNFLEAVKRAPAPAETPLVAKTDKAPKDYVFISHPQLRGYMVHPDIAPDMKFIFNAKEVGPIIGAMDAVNSTQKRLTVSMSLFHVTALEHAMLGATRFLQAPGVFLKSLGQSFAPLVFGEHLAIKMVKEGGVGDVVDSAMKDGLEFSLDHQGKSVSTEDAMSTAYKGLNAATKFLDGAVPGLGKVTTGAVMQLNHAFDAAMWGRFHTTLKLTTYLDKVRALSMNNAREVEAGRAQLKSRDEIGRAAASFTNDLYGGLNWHQMVGELESRWGREIASAAFSPQGRLGMRLMLFAPDWTISTTRAFAKAFSGRGLAAMGGAVVADQFGVEDKDHRLMAGLVGAAAGYGAGRMAGVKGTGRTLAQDLRGITRPTEIADLHRQYVLRSAFLYSTIVGAVNYQLSGHNFWENKDPTRLDLGDGRTMQVSKHFMEPFHWLIDPKKQAMGKASFLVKETANQLGDTEYWTPGGAPRMDRTPKGEPVTLPSRLEHAGKQFMPISMQGLEDTNPSKMAWSAAGMPIYGHTFQEQQEAKAARKAAAIQRRIDKRNKESR